MRAAQWTQPGVLSNVAAAGRAFRGLRGCSVARAARALDDGQGWIRALCNGLLCLRSSRERDPRSAVSRASWILCRVQGQIYGLP